MIAICLGLILGLTVLAFGVIAVLRYETEDDPVEGIHD